MGKQVIAIDMDDVLAELLNAWVDVVNKSEDDNVVASNIIGWNVDAHFKCGTKVYEYLSYDLYRNLPVMHESQRVVKALSEKYEIIIVTSATSYLDSLKAKVEWIHEHFDFIPLKNIILCGRKDFIKADIMIDDGVHNIETFDGRGLLFTAGHNLTETRFERVNGWLDVEQLLLQTSVSGGATV